MKLKDIISKVGGEVFKNAVPGGGILLDVVNEFLPNGQRLDKGATGSDVRAQIEKLPAGLQASLYGKEFDVEAEQIREGNATLRAMIEAERQSPHTTRPFVIKGSFLVVAFVVVLCVTVWAYGAVSGNTALVEVIARGWPFVLSAIGPFAVLLRAYFGVLQSEHRDRLSAVTGQPTGGLLTRLLGKL